MLSLKHSKIYRGGVTSPDLSFETSSCSARVNTIEATLEIQFNIASKGGGSTRVSVRIGREDLPAILEEIARKMPESVGALSDCAAIANRQNLEALEEARRVHDDDKERVKNLIEDLGAVEQLVLEKYKDLRAGDDEREAKIREKLETAMASLCELQ